MDKLEYLKAELDHAEQDDAIPKDEKEKKIKLLEDRIKIAEQEPIGYRHILPKGSVVQNTETGENVRIKNNFKTDNANSDKDAINNIKYGISQKVFNGTIKPGSIKINKSDIEMREIPASKK